MSSPIASCIEQQTRLDIVEEEDLVWVIRKSGVAAYSFSYISLAETCQRFDARDGGSIRIVILGLYLETSSNGE